METDEYVILVDDKDTQIGVALKKDVHTSNTPLHRAFSAFLFNEQNELLVTKRSLQKKTFPGVWTNSVCGHPSPGEQTEQAIYRRLSVELGITSAKAKMVSEYRYRFADIHGIVENEICPIYIAFTSQHPTCNLSEVDSWKWMRWEDFWQDIHSHSSIYSPWCIEEAEILQSQKSFVSDGV